MIKSDSNILLRITIGFEFDWKLKSRCEDRAEQLASLLKIFLGIEIFILIFKFTVLTGEIF